jgi:hypothetical protein
MKTVGEKFEKEISTVGGSPSCTRGAKSDGEFSSGTVRELLKIEKHEDRMITAMVQLTTSNERLNRRLAGLTWVMLTLTWITFVIAIPNTLATIFGIPRVSQSLSLEVMIAALIISTAAALLLVALPDSVLSLSNLEKRFRKMTKNE